VPKEEEYKGKGGGNNIFNNKLVNINEEIT
jgi:hypothetical protein